MTENAVQVRRLLPDEASRYRDIRLEGLEQDPAAFGSTFEDEAAEPLGFFADRLRNSAVFGAFRGDDLLGIAAFRTPPGAKNAHKGQLAGMYVRREARRQGVGRRLVEAVVAHARQVVELVQLTVVSDNEAARRLYDSFGFVAYGIERHAMKHRGRYYDDVLMALPLVLASEGADREGQRQRQPGQ